ncbi:MAG: AAA family ATPase [Bacteroidota bacterium]
MPKPSEIIANKFPFKPTAGQRALFSLLDEFLLTKELDPTILLIKGYAGTGKTSVISTVTKILPLFNFKFVLLAPTGRAAKVMSSYSKRMAFTIHKRIYKQAADPDSGVLKFKGQKNYAKNTVFIVDEASMLSEDREFGSQGLLSDLIQYTLSDASNKLILVGDAAQLPPVGQTLSLGLDQDYLRKSYKSKVLVAELTEVMRQAQDSGILENATSLRAILGQKQIEIKFRTKGYPDIYRMTGERMEDGIRYAYDKYGVENTIVICRSNRNANAYNNYIRNQIHFCQDEIEAGDMLMCVRNNYLFVPETIPGAFIANGDFMEVMKIISFEEMYGLRFATLALRLVDYPDHEPFEAKVMLGTLTADTASLTTEEYRSLYAQVLEDYQDLASKKERNEAMAKDPYLNALQIKFAYALTCHKSQGGQWNAVFIDQGYLTEEMLDKDYIRWLYTGITRATDELFLVNFNANFF